MAALDTSIGLSKKAQEVFGLVPPTTAELSYAHLSDQATRCLAKHVGGVFVPNSSFIRNIQLSVSRYYVSFTTYGGYLMMNGVFQDSAISPWNESGVTNVEAVRLLAEFLHSKGKTIDQALLNDEAKRTQVANDSSAFYKLLDRGEALYEKEEDKGVVEMEKRMKKAASACLAEIQATRGASELAVSKDLYPGFGKDVSQFLVKPSGRAEPTNQERQRNLDAMRAAAGQGAQGGRKKSRRAKKARGTRRR
jgi:hypothetical protein